MQTLELIELLKANLEEHGDLEIGRWDMWEDKTVDIRQIKLMVHTPRGTLPGEGVRFLMID